MAPDAGTRRPRRHAIQRAGRLAAGGCAGGAQRGVCPRGVGFLARGAPAGSAAQKRWRAPRHAGGWCCSQVPVAGRLRAAASGSWKTPPRRGRSRATGPLHPAGKGPAQPAGGCARVCGKTREYQLFCRISGPPCVAPPLLGGGGGRRGTFQPSHATPKGHDFLGAKLCARCGAIFGRKCVANSFGWFFCACAFVKAYWVVYITE